MPLRDRAIWLSVGAYALLAACSGAVDQARLPPPGPSVSQSIAVSDDPVKIGPPYAVRGVTYTPEDSLDYDEVGYASWYGEEQQGNDTANGEAFRSDGVSAAHRTLPMPSYVEVTALDTGRTILVRVNDRGPFSSDRLIDLSRGAAEQLGTTGGTSAVRVRRVNPPEQERMALRSGRPAAARLDTPDPLLSALRGKLGKAPGRPVVVPTMPKRKPAAETRYAPPPATARPASPATVAPASGGYIVQVAAFSSRQRAEDMARRIGARAIEGGGLWRVRLGPYATMQDAKSGVDIAASRGYAGAKIMANDTP